MKVKELIKILKEDGWYQARQRGSHRQFRHPVKSGTVTVPISCIKSHQKSPEGPVFIGLAA